MNIIIKTTNMELASDLEQWIRSRIEPLVRLDKFLQEPDVEVWVEIGRITRGQRTGKIFRAEAQLNLPGKSIRAEAITENIKKSINEVKEKLQREIKEYKEYRRAQD